VIVALVSLHEAADLVLVFGLTGFAVFGWSRLRRRDSLRRVERKERQAAYELRRLRRDREFRGPLETRCLGGCDAPTAGQRWGSAR
jgi:hypothetical protein